MHSVDERDSVVELSELPRPSASDPAPVMSANEHSVRLAYYTYSSPDEVALVAFLQPHVHLFGAPNDEALEGHPLYAKGLSFYSAFEVHDSSWIRDLERMNRIHKRHEPSHFARLRHFIITFHDTTFE